MTEEQATPAARKRRPKRQLTPSQKYEIWLQMIRQEVTMAEAAATAGVDRSTIVRIRQVAKDGALAALAASKPGAGSKVRDAELKRHGFPAASILIRKDAGHGKALHV